MKKLLLLPLLLLFASLAFAQGSINIPPCNGTNGPNCTDYFGAANWANSPLPAGVVNGFTLISGGSGYANPVVVISDPTGSNASATASATGGVISGLTVTSGGSAYIMPQVTIIDVGAGGSLAAPTCGTAPLPACGSGALATATLGGPFTGGIPKFVDAFKDLKNFIATPDTTTFPGSDYYEIALVQYSEKLSSALNPTLLRGYFQLPSGSTSCPTAPGAQYLGPVIVAQKNRAVRVKFTNCLPTGTGGNLFVPVDTTYMGSGPGYLENRATLHLHGGVTPWISDGTPHQWTVPVGEGGNQRGQSAALVPDMFFDSTGKVTALPECSSTVTSNCWPTAVPQGLSNDPGQGSLTFYWTNEQGGRLMFYHDHAYGITRLNVYAGEAAGYLLIDPVEEDLLAKASAPGTIGGTTPTDLAHLIPLVIQDKTFVPSAPQIAAQDPTWTANFGETPGSAVTGDLWFPHVYMTNQNPADPGGANAFGRWDYGPWFFPPQTSLTAANPPTNVTVPCTSNGYPGQVLDCPITPNPSGTPEAFMDTPLVNGVAYPVLHVAPAAYRFKILSAGNDRSWNLSWFVADPTQSNTEVAMLPAVPPSTGTALPLCSAINPVAVPGLDMGLVSALFDGSGNPINGTGLPSGCWPNFGPQPGIPKAQAMWAADGRSGGAPDPRAAGPAWVQIGSEGGLLPTPVVIPATPIGYEQNTRSVTVTNVSVHGLWLGPAERADVIVDFSAFTGKTLILYNDAPAPTPGFDSRTDYFTGDGDQTPIGGAPNTQPGYGPNTRTIMQVIVDGTAPNSTPFSVGALKSAFTPTATSPSIFQATQPTIVVPETAYSTTYGQAFSNKYAAIQSNSMTFTPIAPQNFDNPCAATAPLACDTFGQKTIQELFTLDYGRMNATLGLELPFTNFQTQTTIPYGYIDPVTEIIQSGQTQLWKITHNGVDTHFVHFHLFNVQVVNRMGWDGTIRPPDANELGWKDTVRMNPLEDVLVALQPLTPLLPFPLPDSIRMMDVTAANGSSTQFTGVDPNNNPVTILNAPANLGWEYVWHCHILGHEENDMMRPIAFQVAPPAPTNLAATANSTGGINITWTDNAASESGYNLQRSTDPTFQTAVTDLLTNTGASAPNTAFGATLTYVDTTAPPNTQLYYRIQAEDDFLPASPLQAPFRLLPMYSAWVGPVPFVANPIAVISPTSLPFGNQMVGTTSNPLSLTLSNIGTATLAVNSITIVGANAADFAIATNTCGGSVIPNSPCTVSITFSPSAVGSRAASVALSTNDPVNPNLNVALSGTGTALTAIQINAPTIVYGNNGVVTLTVTSPQVTPVTGTVNLSIDGAAALSLPLVNGVAVFNSSNASALTAPAAGTHTLTANYAAQGGFGASTATGTLAVTPAALTITASSGTMVYGGPLPIISPSYVGFVLGQNNLTALTTQPVCSTTATSASPVSGSPYPTKCVGAVAPNYAITYVNGTVAVGKATTLTAITSNLPNPAILGQIVTIKVQVTPQFPGTTPTGTVAITASTGETCNAPLSGGAGTCMLTFFSGGSRNLTASYPGDPNVTGSTSTPRTQIVSGVSLSTTALLFGDQLLNTNSASQAVTLANVGLTTLTINSISIVGADFTRTTNCGPTLTAGRSCRINVTFRPTALGVRTGSLVIADSDGTSPQSVSLTGTGIGPVLVVAPTALPFTTTIGVTTAAQQVTVGNTGTAPLTINNISLTGANPNQFAENNTCGPFPASLATGASCTINVTFTPTTVATPKTANLNVNVAAPSTSQAVTLTGTVNFPVNTVTPPALAFGTQLRNTTSAPKPVTVRNTGTASLIITNITIGGLNANQFAQTNTCGTFPATIAVGGSCTVNVTFRPTGAGNRTATLRVTASAPAGSQTVALGGTGQ